MRGVKKETFGKVRITASQRRTKIRKHIEETGLWNLNKSRLAKEFDVSETQIRKDIKMIIKDMPADRVHEPKVELFNAFIKAQKELRKLLNDGTTSQKIQAINTMIHLSDKFTKLLEDYGLKSKVPDEIKVTEYGLADAYAEEMAKKKEEGGMNETS